jgi:hypothetical protein
MSLLSDAKALMTGVTNIYIGSMPETPDNAVCLYNTGGYPRDLSGSEVEEPTFMVKVRNTSYATGEALCCTIKDALHGYIGGKFLLIQQQGDVLDMGRDASNRQEWTLNFRCFYRR